MTEHPSIPSPSPTPDVVAQLLDESEARGQCIVTIDRLVEASGLPHIVVRHQLEQLPGRVAMLPSTQGAYLIVSPQYRALGAPPVTHWLDDYCHLKGQPYYLGLLSAAAMHGSTHRALQVAQVVTTRPIHPLAVGHVRLEFHVKANLDQTPLATLPDLPASLAVSTPEATAVDLIAFQSGIGGIRSAARVISLMQPFMSPAGLQQALAAEPHIAVRQRLGYVFEVLRLDVLAQVVVQGLPARMAPALLQLTGGAALPTAPVREPWKVIDNVGLGTSL